MLEVTIGVIQACSNGFRVQGFGLGFKIYKGFRVCFLGFSVFQALCVKMFYMGGCQNYGPFCPYYNTAPII